MPRHTTAAVFDGPGQPLKLTEVELPALADGETLVEVTLCTICGSDLHTYTGRRSCACPTILGHEITGKIVEVAGSVCDLSGTELTPGDRVTWSIAASCGECFYCANSIPQKCEQLAKYGHEPLSTHGAVGGLSPHCRILPGTAIVKVPDSLSDAEVCPANCCTATAAAALRTAGSIEGASITILGAGSLGITAAEMAVHRGASNVILADLDTVRLDRARAIPGCLPVSVADEEDSLSRLIADRTEGRGVDIVLEMTGSTDAAEQSLDLLRIGGRLILVGAVFPGRAMQLSAEQIVRGLIHIEGVHNYRPEDLQAAVSFLESAAEESPARILVEREFPLEEAEAAFQFAADHRPLRVAVRMT